MAATRVDRAPDSGVWPNTDPSAVEIRVARQSVLAETEIRLHPAGMDGQRAPTCRPQPPVELQSEQQVGQLAFAVRGERPVAAVLPVRVVEVEVGPPVGVRGNDHDSTGDQRQQQRGEQEVAEVVGPQLQLEAVSRLRPSGRHHTGVVDHDVDRVGPGAREVPYGGEIGEVQGSHLECCAWCRRAQVRRDGGSLVDVANRHDHACARVRQGSRGRSSDATGGAGDDDRTAGQVGQVELRGGRHPATLLDGVRPGRRPRVLL